MEKIIIEYDETIFTDKVAIEYVEDVIKRGKVSETNGRKQYCFLTTYDGGNWSSIYNKRITVYCPPRYKEKSDKFIVTKQ